MAGAIISFICGIALLFFGADLLIGSATRLSRHLKVSPLIIGATIVAIGTSLPEFFISLVAQIENSEGLSLGNIIGSNIANYNLILGTAILLDPLIIGKNKTQQNNYLALTATLIFILFVYFKLLNPIIGVFFLTSSLIYVFWAIEKGIDGGSHEDRRLFQKKSAAYPDHEKLHLVFIRLAVIFSAVIFSSKLIVDSSLFMAKALKISDSFFGLTIVAIGTSLPELAATLAGAWRHEGKLIVGNLIGSNIINILLVGGSAVVFGAHQFAGHKALIFLAVSTTLVFFIIRKHKGKIISKKWGVGLLIFYLFYLAIITPAAIL